MSYILVGSQRSPYVRICRMLMLQHSLPFEFRVLNFVDDPGDAALLAKETPINRVPILMDGTQKIFDSRVIVNHLIRKHGLPQLSLEDENRISTIYSCLETGVCLFLMKRDGYDMERPGFFLARQKKRIPEALDYLSSWVKTLQPSRSSDWNYMSMALFSFLYWAEKRDLLRLSEHPVHLDFMRKFENAPGVQETGF